MENPHRGALSSGGTGEQGRRQEDKQQDACVAALGGAPHVQLWDSVNR